MSFIRINKNPTGRQLVAFGVAWFAFLGLLGWGSWSRGRHPSAEIAWTLAALVPLAGLLSTRLLRLVFLATSYVTYPLGLAVSRVVLALVYYLVVTPIGLAMRLFRYDPLCRRFDPKAKTYWIRRNGTKTAESYFRQS